MIYARCEVIDDPGARWSTRLVAINAEGVELDDDGWAALRRSVTQRAAKRVLLKFVPERYVSWDHAKLGGRY